MLQGPPYQPKTLGKLPSGTLDPMCLMDEVLTGSKASDGGGGGGGRGCLLAADVLGSKKTSVVCWVLRDMYHLSSLRKRPESWRWIPTLLLNIWLTSPWWTSKTPGVCLRFESFCRDDAVYLMLCLITLNEWHIPHKNDHSYAGIWIVKREWYYLNHATGLNLHAEIKNAQIYRSHWNYSVPLNIYKAAASR